MWPGGGSQHGHGEEDVTELSLRWETREKKLPVRRADRESRATTTYETWSSPSYLFCSHLLLGVQWLPSTQRISVFTAIHSSPMLPPTSRKAAVSKRARGLEFILDCPSKEFENRCST